MLLATSLPIRLKDHSKDSKNRMTADLSTSRFAIKRIGERTLSGPPGLPSEQRMISRHDAAASLVLALALI